MKHRVRFTLSVISLLALLTACAAAQNPEEARKNSEDKRAMIEKILTQQDIKIPVESFKVVGTKMGYEMKAVKGAPYSATAETETIQSLADGNRIRNKSATVVYRDSEGRTRRESAATKKGLPAEIFINDPTSGTSYYLDTLHRVAMKSQFNAPELAMAKKKLVEAEMKQREMKQKTQEGGQTVRAEGEGIVRERPELHTESLSQQMIEGVQCEGTRSTYTIPAGAAGNDLPIIIVREQWYSPELQVFVLTKQNDPRSGENTYRLTNIIRSEPAPSLFQVPGDYKVEESIMRMATPAMPVPTIKKQENDK